MRNLLAEKRTLTDDEGNEIKWDYLKQLEELKSHEGLRTGNKLTQRHIKLEKTENESECLS